MSETPDAFLMTSTEAGEALAKIAEQFRGAPPTDKPTTPSEAKARLDHLSKDKAWRDRYMASNPEARKEFNSLTEMAAADSFASEHEYVDSVSDPHAMPRSRYDGLVEGLREQGMPESGEQYLRDLDAGVRSDRPTAGDGKAAQEALNWLLRDLAVTKPDTREAHRLHTIRARLANIVALAADDGEPVTPALVQRLSELGLR